MLIPQIHYLLGSSQLPGNGPDPLAAFPCYMLYTSFKTIDARHHSSPVGHLASQEPAHECAQPASDGFPFDVFRTPRTNAPAATVFQAAGAWSELDHFDVPQRYRLAFQQQVQSELAIDPDDTQTAFATRSSGELMHSLAVLSVRRKACTRSVGASCPVVALNACNASSC